MTQRYSYSAIQDFKACPLRFLYKHEIGLRLRTEGISQHHLVWGKAMHSALEYLYNGNYMYGDPNYPHFKEDIKNAQEIFATGYPVQLDPDDHAKTQDNGLRILDMYARRWVEEDKRWKVLDVELLDCDLLDESEDDEGDEEKSYYSRRLDMVVEDLRFGGVYGVDHKTVGGRNRELKSKYWDTFDPNSQITQYVDWIRQKYGRCDGFYINAIGVNWRNELKSNGYFNGETFEPDDPAQPWLNFSHYELRKPKNSKTEKMRAWGLTVEFRREMFSRNEVQIEQEKRSTAYWIELIQTAKLLCQCGHIEKDHDDRGCVGTSCDCRMFTTVYGFNTSSCTYCEYRGNDAQPGPCKAGLSWPVDQLLIELSYRRECRKVIMLTCPECDGRGVELAALDWMLAEIRSKATAGELFDVVIPPCVKCKGTRTVQGPRCVLDLAHTGGCSNEPPLAVGRGEFEVEVTI